MYSAHPGIRFSNEDGGNIVEMKFVLAVGA